MAEEKKKAVYNGDHPKRNDAKRVATVRAKKRPRNTIIVKKRIQGKSTRVIAEELTKIGHPICASQVHNILKKDEIKAMLEKEYCRLATAVPKVTQNIINAANDFSKEQESDDKKISWEANKLIAQAHGMLPTSSQSIVHQTYIQNQVNTIIPPVIAELAAKHFGGFINMQNKAIEHEQSNIIDIAEEKKDVGTP